MPAARAASSREAPSSTRASIRREAAASRHRLASRRSPTAPGSFRVIATVMAPPPIGHTADQPRRAPRGSGRDDASAIRAVGITGLIVAWKGKAEACDFPKGHPLPIFSKDKKVDKGRHQSSYLRIYKLNDSIEVWGKHSNGSRTHGQTFRTIIEFLNDKGQIMYAIRKIHGVDGSYGGAAREECWTETVKDPAILSAVR